jgi:EAL domain-containing protein (putative c-di-GMP-specific phosphodiesterase class I)
MLELARSINLRVVAEGVEREEQWRALDEMGCDLVQGYVIARPQGPERMNKLMETLNGAAQHDSREPQAALNARAVLRPAAS